MGPLDALWHLLNFFGPAVGVGLITAVLARLAWWRELRAVPFGRLAGAAVAAGSVALLAGLLLFGRDGRMATYGLLVAAVAVVLWWLGPRRA